MTWVRLTALILQSSSVFAELWDYVTQTQECRTFQNENTHLCNNLIKTENTHVSFK